MYGDTEGRVRRYIRAELVTYARPMVVPEAASFVFQRGCIP